MKITYSLISFFLTFLQVASASWKERPDDFLGREVRLEIGGARLEESKEIPRPAGFTVFRLNEKYIPQNDETTRGGRIPSPFSDDFDPDANFHGYDVTDLVYVSNGKLEMFTQLFVANAETDEQLIIKRSTGPVDPFLGREQPVTFHWRRTKTLSAVLWQKDEKFVLVIR